MILVTSCNSNSNTIKLNNDDWKDYSVIRLDQSLTNDSINEIHQKFRSYTELYENFYVKMIRAGKKEEILSNTISIETKQKLSLFINDTIIKDILQEIQLKFTNIDYYKNEIGKGLSRYETLFGKTYSPKKIGTFFSLFNSDVHEFDSIVWIGLDMYLGSENNIIKLLPTESLPNYIKNKMDEKYIISDVLFGYLMTHNSQYLGDDFLSRMLAYGKIGYVMNLILPDEDPENKFRYNKDELEWCVNNEKYIWQYIIDKEILYEKNFNKISYFFNPGPNTKNFGSDSPAHIGIWLGYRIIEDYAKATDLDIKEILKEKNVQKLLSTYEPK